MTDRLRIVKWVFVASAVLAAGFLLGQVVAVDSSARASAAADETSGSALPIRRAGSSILADVAEAVGPGVVFIRTERKAEQNNSRERSETPWDFFREYFDQEDGRGRRYHGDGGGSGFVFDREGRIFTNHHVIRDADRIWVSVNGVEHEAEIVGVDPLSDIAIIQIEPPDKMTVVELGNSDGMRVGDWVMAIGTPFGTLQGSVTAGIVSAVGRNDLRIMGGQAIYQNYIQTDASINFGNSGGPLVNLKGEAIGINTAINPSGQGIGFAIPINMAKNIMGQLIEKGQVAYGYMGISLQGMDRELAEGRGLDIDHGILVTQVLPSTPAGRAGIEQGDVIVAYDGSEVVEENQFRMDVANTHPGTTVPMRVYRGGKTLDMSIEIGERPEQVVVAQEDAGEESVWLGLHVDEATKREYRRRYSVERDQAGVIVLDVEAGSPAEEAGIREGDIITEVYTQEVDGLEDYVSVAEKLKDRKAAIAFLVKRGRSTQYVTVNPDGR